MNFIQGSHAPWKTLNILEKKLFLENPEMSWDFGQSARKELSDGRHYTFGHDDYYSASSNP
jgi:hypothetical protein